MIRLLGKIEFKSFLLFSHKVDLSRELPIRLKRCDYRALRFHTINTAL